MVNRPLIQHVHFPCQWFLSFFPETAEETGAWTSPALIVLFLHWNEIFKIYHQSSWSSIFELLASAFTGDRLFFLPGLCPSSCLSLCRRLIVFIAGPADALTGALKECSEELHYQTSFLWGPREDMIRLCVYDGDRWTLDLYMGGWFGQPDYFQGWWDLKGVGSSNCWLMWIGLIDCFLWHGELPHSAEQSERLWSGLTWLTTGPACANNTTEQSLCVHMSFCAVNR